MKMYNKDTGREERKKRRMKQRKGKKEDNQPVEWEETQEEMERGEEDALNNFE